ncbi:MAG: acyl-CoA dehydrogenase [Pseudomonadota bacterium]|nr:acyl-CoA dehydrogenase [Pseudomonadota bacterium]
MAFVSPVNQMIFAATRMANFKHLKDSGVWPELNEDFLESLLKEAAKLSDKEIAPLNRIGDQHGCRLQEDNVLTAPGFKEAYKKFKDAGWSAISGSLENGGQGLPILLSVMIQELWNAACMSFSLCPMLSQGAIEAITHHGTKEQKSLYLPKLISGEWTGTMNLTEPQAGSDLGSLRTSAKKNDDGTYSIKGTKIYITFGEHDMAENIIHLVLARIEGSPEGNKGISLFLVPKFLINQERNLEKRNDLKCIGLEEKLGIHASPTCTMSFGDNDGAIGYLIGKENEGLTCMFTMMNNARLNVGMQGVGISERSLQQALEYSKERVQGKIFKTEKSSDNTSTEIINHPDVQRMLLEMRCLTEATRALCYDNAIAIDLGRNHPDQEIRKQYKSKADLLTPVSKAWSTDIGVFVASLGIQIHGGMGFIEETGAAQHLRDARISPIYEGTNGIQAIDLVTRKLFLEGGKVIERFLMEIEETIDACQKKNNTELLKVGENLKESLNDLRNATNKMLEWIVNGDNKLEILSNASDYLELLGIVSGGHYLTKGAVSISEQNQKSMLKGKIDLAYFYCCSYLLKSNGLCISICSGNKILEEEFTSTAGVFNG